MQAYSNPKRESDPHALPDLEVFYIDENDIEVCEFCNEVGNGSGHIDHVGYYWWSCFPGCLPDSDPMGPFETEEAALADAREGAEDEEADPDAVS